MFVFALSILHSVAWAEDVSVTEAGLTPSETTPLYEPPTIYIGGRDVIREVMLLQHDKVDIELPSGLKTRQHIGYLENRKRYPLPGHAPTWGEPGADITIIEFSDPGCQGCQSDLQAFEDVMAKLLDQRHPPKIRRYHIYVPSENAGPLGLAAFYARVAERVDKFWEYRQALITANTSNEQSYFTTLAELNVPTQRIRKIAIEDARKIYEELDEDVKQFQRYNLPPAPFWLLNGILVGNTYGIPVMHIPEIVTYERNRLREIRIRTGTIPPK